MKKTFHIICLALAGSVFAQVVSEEDIIGVYQPKNNDPTGGSTTVFLPDQNIFTQEQELIQLHAA